MEIYMVDEIDLGGSSWEVRRLRRRAQWIGIFVGHIIESSLFILLRFLMSI
jgi:hypothetical protein